MSSAQSAYLEPSDHVVNFYDDDEHLVSDVNEFVSARFRRGEVVVIAATQSSELAMVDQLCSSWGIDELETGKVVWCELPLFGTAWN